MSMMTIVKCAAHLEIGTEVMIGLLSAVFLAIAQPALAQQTAVGPPLKPAGNSPVKVFILAGQSNMARAAPIWTAKTTTRAKGR